MKILLAEDDPNIADNLIQNLKTQDYAVDWVENGILAEESIKGGHYDILILDLGLPGRDGIDVIDNLRKQKSQIPILILTAKSSTEDCVEALTLGADDYLTKPFKFEEVNARLLALVRRSQGRTSKAIKYRDVEIDPSKHQLSFRGKVLDVPRREFSLLATLMANPDHVMTREQLLGKLYTWDDDIASNVLEVHIHNLRKMLGKDYIKTVRGVGYKLGDNKTAKR